MNPAHIEGLKITHIFKDLGLRMKTYRFQRHIFSMGVAALSISCGMTVQAQNLHEAVMIALAQYPAILAAQSKIDAADSDIIRAQGAHWPQVAWTGTYNAYNTGNVSNNWIQSPTVSMNIWSGWRIQSDVERSKSLADASRQQERITRDDVALQCTEGYLNWAHQIELTRLARENLASHQKIFSDIKRIIEIDPGRGVDLSQAQVRFENAKLTLQQREADLNSAEQRLNRMLLGKIPATPSGIDFAPGLSPGSAQQALTYINDTHPVIAQMRAQVTAAEAAVRNARAQFSPTVNVTYGKQTYQGTAQGDYLAQLVVSVPLFDGGTAYGATGAAQGNLRAIELNLKESELILKERIASFWSDWVSAKNRKLLGISQAKTAQSLVQGYKSQFQVGRRSLLDLLNVQSDLFTYQSNAENAAFEARVARARIMASMGRLAAAYSDPNGPVDKTDLVDQGAERKPSLPPSSPSGNLDWTGTTVGVLPSRLAQPQLTGVYKP